MAARRLHERRPHRLLRARGALRSPHLRGRPLTLQRYPNGIDEPDLLRKANAARHARLDRPRNASNARWSSQPRYVSSLQRSSGARLSFESRSIVLHIWTSRMPALEEPDFVIFDLDPGEKCTLRTLGTVTLAVRDLLGEIGLKPLVKTTGGYGLHVIVPARIRLLLRHRQNFCRARRSARGRRARRTRHPPADHRETIPECGLHRLRASRSRKDDRRAVLGSRPRRSPGLDAAALDAKWKRSRGGAALRRRPTSLPSTRLRTTPRRLEREGDLWGPKHWKKQRLEAGHRQSSAVVVRVRLG